MLTGDQLYLTDVSLCEADLARNQEGAARSVVDAWQSGGLFRVEIPSGASSAGRFAALRAAGAAIAVRCAAAPDQVRTVFAGSETATLWVDSVAALSRRPAGETRPPAVLRLGRAVKAARERRLEVVVAIPFEPDRLRAVLHLSYLAQSHGAHRIRLVESSGRIHPLDLFRSIRSLRERLTVPLELDISDEFGLSAGAALCAIRAGVRHLVVGCSLPPGRPHIPMQALLSCVGAAG